MMVQPVQVDSLMLFATQPSRQRMRTTHRKWSTIWQVHHCEDISREIGSEPLCLGKKGCWFTTRFTRTVCFHLELTIPNPYRPWYQVLMTHHFRTVLFTALPRTSHLEHPTPLQKARFSLPERVRSWRVPQLTFPDALLLTGLILARELMGQLYQISEWVIMMHHSNRICIYIYIPILYI